MRRKLLIAASGALLLLTGCVTQKSERVPTNYFLFNQDPKTGHWRERYDDLVAVAKAYAKEKGVSFNFEGTSTLLWIFQEDGSLIARVEFAGYFGSPYMTADIDTAGRALRHHIGVVSEGHSQ